MPSITKIIALRHGETLWNSIGKQQGHLDSELTESGLLQAKAAGAALKNFKFDFFYSSDLGRAVQTSEIISDIIHMNYSTDIRLRERNLGIMQGFTIPEFEEKYPDEAVRFHQHDPDYRIPGGESIRDRYTRTIECVETIAQRHPGSTVLIVTHGGILTSMFQKAINLPLNQKRTFSVINMGLNTFTISENNQWFLETWGDICHLRGLSAIDDF